MTPANIVQKLWNYCNVLRDDGMSYGDYVETAPVRPALAAFGHPCPAQLTSRLFLKMSDKRTKAPYNKPSAVPAGYDWPSLIFNENNQGKNKLISFFRYHRLITFNHLKIRPESL